MEKGQWGKVREPSLLLSNHPPLWEMREFLKDLSSFSREGSGVAVIMDAAHLKTAKFWFGLDGIPIDVSRIRYRSGELSAYLRSVATRKWGEMTGAYNEALKGKEIVEHICGLINEGRSVFLCPTGVVDTTARWRAGIGLLVREIFKGNLENQVGIGLICVKKDDYVLLPLNDMTEFVGRETIEEVANNRRLAIIMQETWKEKTGQSN